MPTRHEIQPERGTVHGYFSRDLDPVVFVESGDTVVVKTLDAGWHNPPDPVTGNWDHRENIEWYNPDTDTGHALCGPVHVRGAEPGMTLEVALGGVRTGSWGWCVGGGYKSELNERLDVSGEGTFGMTWALDPLTGTARGPKGESLAMKPFLGVMGMPPNDSGILPTAPPRFCGGNIDCKELVSGAKLYLPIAVEGCLFSAGDGHAIQGDGEVSGVAIECPMDEVELTLTLQPGLRLPTPRAWTQAAWITFGFDQSLDEAAVIATNAMLDLLEEVHHLERKEALAVASLVVDLRITQIVNGVKGVHAVLPHGLIAT